MNLPGVYDIFLEKMSDYQTCYMISDCHFGDADLKAGTSNRPSDDELVKCINSRVGRKDVLWILGDCGDIEYVKKLRGYKILVAGNHDKNLTAYKEVFDMVFSGPVMLGPKLILSHEPVDVPWAFNIHGHCHSKNKKSDNHHFNVCADVLDYAPVNLNQWMKQGHLSGIKPLHRTIIDAAAERKAKRGGKKIGKR